MAKQTFLSLLLHFFVFIACTIPSSSFLLNDRSFEISSLPSSRAGNLIRELNLFPKLDANVIDGDDSTLTAAEGPSIVERNFRFPNILADAGDSSDAVQDLGHHAGYYKLPKSQGARFISDPRFSIWFVMARSEVAASSGLSCVLFRFEHWTTMNLKSS